MELSVPPNTQEDYIDQITAELPGAADGAALLAAMRLYDLDVARSDERVRQALTAYQNVRRTSVVDSTKISTALAAI